MRAGRWLVVGWLSAALVVLGMDGRLPVFLAWVGPPTVLALALAVLVRQQRAPSILDPPPLSERYRVADDLQQPLSVVVAVAEREASTGDWLPHRGWKC